MTPNAVSVRSVLLLFCRSFCALTNDLGCGLRCKEAIALPKEMRAVQWNEFAGKEKRRRKVAERKGEGGIKEEKRENSSMQRAMARVARLTLMTVWSETAKVEEYIKWIVSAKEL